MSSPVRLDHPSAARAVAPTRERTTASATTTTEPVAPAPAKKDSFSSTFSTLSTAIASGDIDGAQQALDAAVGDRGAAYSRTTPPGRGPAVTPAHSNSRWNRQADFQDLVSAVRAGDVEGSQAALEAFQTKGRVAPTPAPTPDPTVDPAPVTDPVVAPGTSPGTVPVTEPATEPVTTPVAAPATAPALSIPTDDTSLDLLDLLPPPSDGPAEATTTVA